MRYCIGALQVARRHFGEVSPIAVTSEEFFPERQLNTRFGPRVKLLGSVLFVAIFGASDATIFSVRIIVMRAKILGVQAKCVHI